MWALKAENSLCNHAVWLGPCSIWATSSEKGPSSICKVHRFRSSCSCTKYHLGLCSPFIPLRKHAYSNILKILPPKKKKKKISDKNFWYFSYFCSKHRLWHSLEPPQWGSSNEYPQSMFWAEIRKIMYTPVNPSFTIKKWGLRGSKLYRHVFVMHSVVSNDSVSRQWRAWSDCAEWPWPLLSAHARRHFFKWHSPSRKLAYIILTPLNPPFI